MLWRFRMKKYREIPKISSMDHTICLLLEGYQYITNRRKKYHTQIFQTRLFGKKVICISGVEGAKLFYNHYYFTRKGVIPINIQSTLFGKNGVQTLVGSKHLNRKQMFTSIMADENIEKLSQITRKMWEIESYKWPKKDTIILSQEAKIVLCKAACEWVGIPLNKRKEENIANDFYSLVDAIGSFGKRYLKGCIARKNLEKWLQNEIELIRKRKERSKHDLPAYYIAWYRDNTGNLLDSKTATVELINIIRPIVAISTYITFGLLALQDNPKWIRKIQSRKENKDHTLELFSQEVRRFYPFTPFIGAKVRKNFAWKGYFLKKETLVLLDIYVRLDLSY